MENSSDLEAILENQGRDVLRITTVITCKYTVRTVFHPPGLILGYRLES